MGVVGRRLGELVEVEMAFHHLGGGHLERPDLRRGEAEPAEAIGPGAANSLGVERRDGGRQASRSPLPHGSTVAGRKWSRRGWQSPARVAAGPACQLGRAAARGADRGSSVGSLREQEAETLRRALMAHRGSRRELADKLGISIRTLYRKLVQLDDPRPQSQIGQICNAQPAMFVSVPAGSLSQAGCDRYSYGVAAVGAEATRSRRANNPRRISSGAGGHPGTCRSTGTTSPTPPTTA